MTTYDVIITKLNARLALRQRADLLVAITRFLEIGFHGKSESIKINRRSQNFSRQIFEKSTEVLGYLLNLKIIKKKYSGSK